MAKLSAVERVLRALHGISDEDDAGMALRSLEWSASENGRAACPLCKAHLPLDDANQREFERHAPDCLIASALAA